MSKRKKLSAPACMAAVLVALAVSIGCGDNSAEPKDESTTKPRTPIGIVPDAKRLTSAMRDAKMLEGISGVGIIKLAAMDKLARGGALPTPCTLKTLGVDPAYLNGRYFKFENYAFTRLGGRKYKISATLPGGDTYEVDQDGNLTSGEGYYTKGQ